MSSWTRSAPQATGRLGVGMCPLKGITPRDFDILKDGHIPTDDIVMHTHALLLGMIKALKLLAEKPHLKKKSVEIEFSNSVIPRWFYEKARDCKPTNRGFGYGEIENYNYVTTVTKERSKKLFETLRKQKSFIPERVLSELEDLFDARLEKGENSTKLSFLSDCGRYFSRDMTLTAAPGVVAKGRYDAVQSGAYVMFRSNGENTDLLEVRWAQFCDKVPTCAFDRLRDYSIFEIKCLYDVTRDFESKQEFTDFWDPLKLADHDVNLFWSCVRYGNEWCNFLCETDATIHHQETWSQLLFGQKNISKQSESESESQLGGWEISRKFSLDLYRKTGLIGNTSNLNRNSNDPGTPLDYLSPKESVTIIKKLLLGGDILHEMMEKHPLYDDKSKSKSLKDKPAIKILKNLSEKGDETEEEMQKREMKRELFQAAMKKSPDLKRIFDRMETEGPGVLDSLSEKQKKELEKVFSALGIDSEDEEEEKRFANAQEDKRQMRLFGQQQSCWKCNNVIYDSEADRTMHSKKNPEGNLFAKDETCMVFRCPKCEVATYCCDLHLKQHQEEHANECRLLSIDNDTQEPEAEVSDPSADLVSVLVLPGDDSIKPYIRYIPKEPGLAVAKLKKLLKSDDLEQVTPYRGFQPSWDRNSNRIFKFPSGNDEGTLLNSDVVLIQRDFGKDLKGRAVEIKGLSSAAGQKLNGRKSCYLTGQRTASWREKPMPRYGVYIPSTETDERKCSDLAGKCGEVKALSGGNLRLDSKTVNLQACGSISSANKRASCIATPLFFSEPSGHRDLDLLRQHLSTTMADAANGAGKTESERKKDLDGLISHIKAFTNGEGTTNLFCVDPQPSDKKSIINDDEFELGVRCRGDVIAVRLAHGTGFTAGGLLKETKIGVEPDEEDSTLAVESDSTNAKKLMTNEIEFKKLSKQSTFMAPNPKAVLTSFSTDLYKKTWGIFSIMDTQMPGSRVQMGTMFPDNEQAQEHLANMINSRFDSLESSGGGSKSGSSTVSGSTLSSSIKSKGKKSSRSGGSGSKSGSSSASSAQSSTDFKLQDPLGLKKAEEEIKKLRAQQQASGTLLEDPDPEPENIIGEKVRITGLQNKQHYNGLSGIVKKEIDETSGKYEVEISSENKVLVLKRENLLIDCREK